MYEMEQTEQQNSPQCDGELHLPTEGSVKNCGVKSGVSNRGWFERYSNKNSCKTSILQNILQYFYKYRTKNFNKNSKEIIDRNNISNIEPNNFNIGSNSINNISKSNYDNFKNNNTSLLNGIPIGTHGKKSPFFSKNLIGIPKVTFISGYCYIWGC